MNRSPLPGAASETASAPRKSGRLRRREAVDVVQRRTKQLEQAGEGDVSLGFQPGRPEHAHVLEADQGILQEGGLAHAGLTRDHDSAADTQARSGQQPDDRLALAVPPEELRLHHGHKFRTP